MLRSTLVQITIQPQAEATVSSANRKGLHVALNEVHVLASPMEHFEAGIEFVEQGLAGTVKVIGNMQRAGGQSTKYIVLCILDDN